MSLKAEFDLTEQIYLSHKALNIQANFQHVKGHQDKNKKKKDLPPFAQLNIEADQEAGEYRLQFGKFLPVTPVLPACQAVLSIQGLSVTNNYKSNLIRA